MMDDVTGDDGTLGELDFHRREITADVADALTSLRLALVAPDVATAGVHLLNALSSVEHDLADHLPTATSLSDAARDDGAVGTTCAPMASIVEDSTDATDPAALLEYVVARLDRLSGVEASSKHSAWGDIEATLARAREELQMRYRQARARADLDDPGRAAARRSDERLATPSRERHRADARSLSRCPHCGAPLAGGDRTQDGSFCEVCGTRWAER